MARARLLAPDTRSDGPIYQLRFRLQLGQWAEMYFSDRDMAEHYYLQLTALGVLAGSVIKEYQRAEVAAGHQVEPWRQ